MFKRALIRTVIPAAVVVGTISVASAAQAADADPRVEKVLEALPGLDIGLVGRLLDAIAGDSGLVARLLEGLLGDTGLVSRIIDLLLGGGVPPAVF